MVWGLVCGWLLWSASALSVPRESTGQLSPDLSLEQMDTNVEIDSSIPVLDVLSHEPTPSLRKPLPNGLTTLAQTSLGDDGSNSLKASNDAGDDGQGGGAVNEADAIGEGDRKNSDGMENEEAVRTVDSHTPEVKEDCEVKEPYTLTHQPVTYDPNRVTNMTSSDKMRYVEIMSRYRDEVHSLWRSLGRRPQFEDLTPQLKSQFEELRDLYALDVQGKYGVDEIGVGDCPNMCSGHGSCTTHCECDVGWIHKDCSFYLTVCPFDCQARGLEAGKCIHNDTCECGTDYFGTYCHQLPCPENCSFPNGVCDPTTGECKCSMGFSGESCADSFCPQDCSTPSPHGGVIWKHGKCEEGLCLCEPGWSGSACEKYVCSTCLNGGVCVNSTCECTSDWEDLDCSRPRCENSCSNRGLCDAYGNCQCLPGYGQSDCHENCDLTFGTKEATFVSAKDFSGFAQIMQSGLMPPASSVQATTSFFGRIYLSGGYVANGDSATMSRDMWTYSHTHLKFSKIDVQGGSPPARAYSSAATMAGQMFLFGGTMAPLDVMEEPPEESTVSPVLGDLWSFSYEKETWAPVGQDGEVAPGLFGHTMNPVDATQFALIGGIDEFRTWSRSIFTFDVQTRVWKNLTKVAWDNYLFERNAYEAANPWIPPEPNSTETSAAMFSNSKLLQLRTGMRTKRARPDVVLVSESSSGDDVELIELESKTRSQEYRGVFILPPARAFHASAMYRGKLFVHGGLGFQNREIDYCNETLGSGFTWEGSQYSGALCDESCRIPEVMSDLWEFDFEAKNWTGKAGSFAIDQAPLWVESTYPSPDRCHNEESFLGAVADDSTRPSARYGHTVVVVGAQMYAFGGTNGVDLLMDMWNYDFEEQIWSEVEVSVPESEFSSAVQQPAMSFMAVHLVIDEIVCIFGNLKQQQPPFGLELTDKVFAFSTKTSQWKLIGYGGWTPDARSFGQMTHVNNMLYLFGGRGKLNEKVGFFNDIWRFKLETQFWEYQFISSPTRPPKRSHHTLLLYDATSIMIFGGMDGAGFMNDIWVFNREKNEWRELVADGELPAKRALCGATLISEDEKVKLLVAGGNNNLGMLDDMWIFDPIAKTWEFLDVQGAKPGPRAGLASVSSFMKLYILHGYMNQGTDVVHVEEIWNFEGDSTKWKQLAGTGPPARRWAHSALIAGEFILLHGGFGKDGSLDDLWWYSISRGMWKQEEFGFNFKPSPGYGAASADACGSMWIFGGEVPGFPHSELWVFVVNPDLVKFPGNIEDLGDIAIPAEGVDSLIIEARLEQNPLSDSIKDWQWIIDDTPLKDGKLFEVVPTLQDKLGEIVVTDSGTDTGASDTVLPEPEIANSKTSSLHLTNLVGIPRLDVRVQAFSTLGYEIKSNHFQIIPVGGPLIESIPDSECVEGDSCILEVDAVPGIRGGDLTILWYNDDTKEEVETSATVSFDFKGPFSMILDGLTPGEYRYYAVVSSLLSEVKVTSNVATLVVVSDKG